MKSEPVTQRTPTAGAQIKTHSHRGVQKKAKPKGRLEKLMNPEWKFGEKVLEIHKQNSPRRGDTNKRDIHKPDRQAGSAEAACV